MLKSITTNTQPPSNGQNTSEAEDNSNSGNNKEILQKTAIEGTPFWAIGNDTDGYHLVMGRYRLTPKPAVSIEELKQYLDNNTYYILLQMIIAVKTNDDIQKQIIDTIEQTQKEHIEQNNNNQ